MTRAASSAAGSFALPRAIALSDTQQQQQLGLAAVNSWELPQQQLEQQQQQPWSLYDPAQMQLTIEPSSSSVPACIVETPHSQHQQQQQQQYLQAPDDGGTELRQQLAWQAQQQQQQQELQQLPDAPDDSGAILRQQLALQAHQQQQQQQQTALLPPPHPSPAAASPAARRLVHSSSASSSGSGLASSSSGSGIGLAALGLHRPVACTNSMQQLMDAAGNAAANAAAGGSLAADGAAAAAAVAYKQWHANVSVLFADVQGYTELADKVEPEQVGRIACTLFK
jgi:hypothetical protein